VYSHTAVESIVVVEIVVVEIVVVEIVVVESHSVKSISVVVVLEWTLYSQSGAVAVVEL
jgi:hypothetical protein